MTTASEIIRDDGLTVATGWGDPPSSLDSKVVAVSGASGLIGRHVVAVLLGLSDVYDFPITVVAMGRNRDRLEVALQPWAGDPRLTIRQKGLSPKMWPTNATHLVHAASPSAPAMFRTDPVGVIEANVDGTAYALRHATATGASVVLVSTMEVYGLVPGHDPGIDVNIAESTVGAVDQLDVRSAYPESKRLAETMVVAFSAEYGVRADIARLSHTYGPGTAQGDDRVQVEFMMNALAGQKIVLKTVGSMRRHYTYAADSASAVVRGLATQHERSVPQAFNVADNRLRISIRQLAEHILRAANRPTSDIEIDIDDHAGHGWSVMPGAVFLDTTKIEELGWRPLFDLPTGLARMAAYLAQARGTTG